MDLSLLTPSDVVTDSYLDYLEGGSGWLSILKYDQLLLHVLNSYEREGLHTYPRSASCLVSRGSKIN